MDENRLLISRVDDLVYKACCGEYEGFGFLNEQEVSTAHNYLRNMGMEHNFFGGYPSADRMFLYLGDSFEQSDFIDALEIRVRGEHSLTHRDFLGSLMGLGLNRECIGDIVLIPKGAVIFVRKEISRYISDNLTSVGRATVTVDFYKGDTGALCGGITEQEIIVTSMRVDNLITSLCKCSRQNAVGYISDDRVFVNYSCVSKPSKLLTEGDTVSIRGFGKFKIGKALRRTKSDRIVLSVLMYK